MNWKKIGILCCSCLLTATSVFAQKKKKRTEKPVTQTIEQIENNRAYIQLYDGSTFIGDLISDDNKMLELNVASNDTLTLEHGLIRRVLREREGTTFTRRGRFFYNKGYFVNIMPFTLGVNFNGASYTGQILGGVHLNQRISVGIGTGFEVYSDRISGFGYDVYTTPFYLYGKFNLSRGGSAFYAYGKLGYAFAVDELQWDRNDDIRTSLYSELGLGSTIASRGPVRFIFELGRHFTLVNGDITSWDWQTGNSIRQSFTKLLGRNTLKIGIAIRQ